MVSYISFFLINTLWYATLVAFLFAIPSTSTDKTFYCICLFSLISASYSHLVVWQPSSWKNGDLLSSCDAVHAINGWDTSLDHLLRVDTALRIDGLTCKTHSVSQRDPNKKNNAIQSFCIFHQILRIIQEISNVGVCIKIYIKGNRCLYKITPHIKNKQIGKQQ